MSLKILFVDMNAYFASVEQQFRPELRGRPVAVVPVLADTTCCIAASYEARPFGVKTGTPVGEARRLCPALALVEARHGLYVRVHEAVVAAVETCLPVSHIHSIDEMSCDLSRTDRSPHRAARKAREIKKALRERIGEYLRCSIGAAPNPFLAKVASNVQKPDGLTILSMEDLPHKLHPLDLTDFPGIGSRMHRRLERAGVRTTEQLCALAPNDLERIWGGIVGRRFWLALHGHDVPDLPTRRRTVGHSHVLPPNLRSEQGAHAVLIRLICKATARMRRIGYWAGRLDVFVAFRQGGAWRTWKHLNACQDTPSMLEAFLAMWRRRIDFGQPIHVGVVLSNLVAERSATRPLFPGEQRRVALSRAMDLINARFGRETVHLATVHEVLGAAPTRIAFTNIPDLDDPANWDADQKDEAWRLVPASCTAGSPEWEYVLDDGIDEIRAP
jgi:DNA polymerase-4